MTDALLKLYVGATEYGTDINPISFGAVIAGEATEHPLNPFYLWNDKGGSADSVPAKAIVVSVLNMWIQDEDMGTSDGSIGQTFTASVLPILDNIDPEEILVSVDADQWERVPDLIGYASDAEVYTIDPITGIVTFGNGVNGKIPPLGSEIYITYMPDLQAYGDAVFTDTWLEVKSFGCTTNTITVIDEQLTSIDTTHVIVSNALVMGVTGVWLQTDPTHVGINYYTGGSFASSTGIITLGTALPNATTGVLVNYTYLPINDLESAFYPIGKDFTHQFVNQIPKNNAKLLYFRLNVPDDATPSGGGQVNFRIRLSYRQ